MIKKNSLLSPANAISPDKPRFSLGIKYLNRIIRLRCKQQGNAAGIGIPAQPLRQPVKDIGNTQLFESVLIHTPTVLVQQTVIHIGVMIDPMFNTVWQVFFICRVL